MKKIKQTIRKFYNKWNYKISLDIKGGGVFRIYDPSDILLMNDKSPEIHLLAQEISQIDKSLISKRIESKIFDIYTNDEKIFNRLLEVFENCVRQAYAPSSDFPLDDARVVIAKKLPHNRYQYKVFLQPHKISSKDEKVNFLKWLDTQKPRINITDTVKQWFIITSWNWDRRYMYVEDEKTLLLLKLKNPEPIGTIYTFRVSDK